MSTPPTVCPHCGGPAPSLDAVRSGYRCHYCQNVVEANAPPAPFPMPITVIGRPPPPGVHPPVPALVARATPTSGSSLGRGALVVAAIVFLVFGLGSPKTCSAIVLPGETDSALAAVRKCPRAMELLGADPAPSLVGCTTGESQSGCDSGSGSWSMSVTRERARGTLEIGASKHRTRGWVADSVTLEVGDTRVDVIACKPLPPLD